MDNFMDILYLLIPVSIVLVFIIGGLFWWSLKHSQFDDLEGPGYRILMDDDRPITSASPSSERPAEQQSAQAGKSDKSSA